MGELLVLGLSGSLAAVSLLMYGVVSGLKLISWSINHGAVGALLFLSICFSDLLGVLGL